MHTRALLAVNDDLPYYQDVNDTEFCTGRFFTADDFARYIGLYPHIIGRPARIAA
ncbi:hypothetical protein [Spongiactinospora sp. 9N601]|uniref:hypothetical protein n=1 Tax=Spongiactinospora sp. 9N601 TaxID=3375149 RepID=UPI0037A5AB89